MSEDRADLSAGTPRWLLKSWKELVILIAHSTPFFALAGGTAEVFGYYAVGLMATTCLALLGGEWLMRRWYDSEVLFRDD